MRGPTRILQQVGKDVVSHEGSLRRHSNRHLTAGDIRSSEAQSSRYNTGCARAWFNSTREEYHDRRKVSSHLTHPVFVGGPAAISAAEVGTSPPADNETTVITLDLWVLTLRGPAKRDTSKPLKPFATRVANQIKTIGGRDGMEGLLARLQEQGMLGRLQNFRVTIIGGAEATILCGERAATVTGVTMSDRGQSTNIIYQQVGTVVKLTPIVKPKGTIQVAMSFNRSELAAVTGRRSSRRPAAATQSPPPMCRV